MEDMKKIGRPLTLKQLRKMEGMPAYWPDAGCWGIISVDSMGRWAGIPFFCGRIKEVNITYNIKEKGISVYACPPAHIDREAWTAEWKNHYRSGTIPGLGCVCSFCDMWNERRSDFCPHCGRAMTPEAWDELEKRIGAAK